MENQISKAIRDIRTVHKLTQEGMADMIGVSPAHVGMLEQGRAKPSFDTMKKLKLVYGLSPAALFESDECDVELAATEISILLKTQSNTELQGLLRLLRFAVKVVEVIEQQCNSEGP